MRATVHANLLAQPQRDPRFLSAKSRRARADSRSVLHTADRSRDAVQNRLPRLMVRLDLVTHHAPPAPSRHRGDGMERSAHAADHTQPAQTSTSLLLARDDSAPPRDLARFLSVQPCAQIAEDCVDATVCFMRATRCRPSPTLASASVIRSSQSLAGPISLEAGEGSRRPTTRSRLKHPRRYF